jgi:hypothetical protein
MLTAAIPTSKTQQGMKKHLFLTKLKRHFCGNPVLWKKLKPK